MSPKKSSLGFKLLFFATLFGTILGFSTMSAFAQTQSTSAVGVASRYGNDYAVIRGYSTTDPNASLCLLDVSSGYGIIVYTGSDTVLVPTLPTTPNQGGSAYSIYTSNEGCYNTLSSITTKIYPYHSIDLSIAVTGSNISLVGDITPNNSYPYRDQYIYRTPQDKIQICQDKTDPISVYFKDIEVDLMEEVSPPQLGETFSYTTASSYGYFYYNLQPTSSAANTLGPKSDAVFSIREQANSYQTSPGKTLTFNVPVETVECAVSSSSDQYYTPYSSSSYGYYNYSYSSTIYSQGPFYNTSSSSYSYIPYSAYSSSSYTPMDVTLYSSSSSYLYYPNYSSSSYGYYPNYSSSSYTYYPSYSSSSYSYNTNYSTSSSSYYNPYFYIGSSSKSSSLTTTSINTANSAISTSSKQIVSNVGGQGGVGGGGDIRTGGGDNESTATGGGTIIVLTATVASSSSTQNVSSTPTSSKTAAVQPVAVKSSEVTIVDTDCGTVACKVEVVFKDTVKGNPVSFKPLEKKDTFPGLQGDLVFGLASDITSATKDDIKEIKLYIGDLSMDISSLAAQHSNSPWVRADIKKDAKGYYVTVPSGFKQFAVTKVLSANYVPSSIGGGLIRSGGFYLLSSIFTLVMTLFVILSIKVSLSSSKK